MPRIFFYRALGFEEFEVYSRQTVQYYTHRCLDKCQSVLDIQYLWNVKTC